MEDLNQFLNQLKTELQLNQIQLGPLGTPLTISFYEKWLSENLFGEMEYLKTHLDKKRNPQLLQTELRSVLTVSQNYFPAVVPPEIPLPARIATYAQNKDYHFWLKEKLKTIVSELQERFPTEVFLPYVDSGPVLERNWAYQNGLGWFGKNTCLIHPAEGSLFFIAEILTTLPPTQEIPIEPIPDFCGTCRRCLEICPTNALIEPHVMKADRCISYLTIESKTAPPPELRAQIGDWFFGCDLCQTVCPWNQKVFRKKELVNKHETQTTLKLTLSENEELELLEFFRFILTSSNKKIEKHFYGTALMRAGGNGLKRNALIVIANRKMNALRPEVLEMKAHPKWGELSEWCYSQLVN